MGGAFPLPSGMGNVPQQQKGAELSVAESLQQQRSSHRGEKPINSIRSRARGRPWREVRVQSGLHMGETEPHDKGGPETSVPRCYSHAQTEWREGFFFFFFKGCVEI